MPLQNRVDPFGDIHAVDARGMFTGNRGIIHDPATKTLLRKRWATKAWIICSCEYKGVRREPMGRNSPNGNAGWTELFFLDEVTALAAGHRPCFTCRRERARNSRHVLRSAVNSRRNRRPRGSTVSCMANARACGRHHPRLDSGRPEDAARWSNDRATRLSARNSWMTWLAPLVQSSGYGALRPNWRRAY